MAINFSGTRYDRSPKQDKPSAPQTNAPAAAATGTASDTFNRYIGYDNEKDFTELLISFYVGTKTNGLFFDKPIANPANPEVNKISSLITIPDEPDKETIKGFLEKLRASSVLDITRFGTVKTTDDAAAKMMEVLKEVKNDSPSPSAQKNAMVKFFCWLVRYNTYPVKSILYIGSITRHEVYWLWYVSKLGCKVNYVNYTDENSYRECDTESEYSVLHEGSLKAPLSLNLGKVNVEQYADKQHANEKINAIVNASDPLMIKYLQTDWEFIFKEMLTTLELRQAKLLCTDTTIPVYFTACIGLNEETTYNNSLYTAKEEMASSGRQFTLLTELRKPGYSDAEKYYTIQKTNDSAMVAKFAEKFKINDNLGRTVLAQKAFIDAVNSIQTNNLFNTCVMLSCWFDQITSQFDFFRNDIPAVMYYGKITLPELHFLNVLARSGMDVFYFNPDKSILKLVTSAGFADLTVLEGKDSRSDMPFPDRMIKTKLATMAYDAEKSLDTILYNDNTMFRTHQFSFSRNQTLTTTFEELGLMWHQQAMYRTGFDSRTEYVIVPNLFAKVSGIPKGDVQEYYKDIAFKLAPMSVYFNKVPFFKPSSGVRRDQAQKISNGRKIDIEALKNSPLNKYNYLTDNIQYLIFSKMQEVIDSGFITVPDTDIVPLVLTVGLNIPNNLLQIIQKFDFTKDIPKIVIVSAGQKTFEAPECILLVLFNLIGFDIIVYTPTGYKNLESFIRPEAFQEFIHGEFKYDFRPQNLAIPKEIPQEKTSFFGRIFKGKK
ncbi:YceG family protein [Ruminococcus sp. HUN007]|uniref:YceG family protein n=1 Tax=Ruminococcus sp. HUN007 TaxID=1514668 RepID=UPI0005D2AE4C|nr:YceG family protein [Ruminococcus sp. HUN007]